MIQRVIKCVVEEGVVKGSMYRVIHKSLRDFRTRLRNNQDRHGRKEHIIGIESLQVIFVLGALAYFWVPPLGVVVKKNGVHSE